MPFGNLKHIIVSTIILIRFNNIFTNILKDQLIIEDYGKEFSEILHVIGAVTEAEDYSDTIFLIDINGIINEVDIVFDKNAFIIYDINNTQAIPRHNFINSSYLYLVDKPKLDVFHMLQKFYKWDNYDVQTPVNVYVHSLSMEEELDCYNWMTRIFKKLWLKNVTRILIIFWSNVSKSLQWFTYHVFKRKIYNRTGNYKLSKNISLSHIDMNGHLLDICIYDLPPASIVIRDNHSNLAISGTDGYAMKIILKSMNATYRLTYEDETQEGSLVASRNNLINHRCDVLFTSQYFVDNSKPDLQYIYPVQLDSWCVMVPKADKKHDANRFMKPFSGKVWISTLICVALIIIIWSAFFRLYQKIHKINNTTFNIFHLCGLFVNYTIYINWQIVQNSARILNLAVIAYNFFLTQSYLGLLFGSLVTPVYHDDINTLNEVNNLGLRIVVYEEELNKWIELGLNHSDMSRLFLPEPNMSKILEMRDNHNIDYAYAVRRRNAHFIINQAIHTEKGRPIYHIVEECFLPTYVSYVVTIDFPYARRIEHYQSVLKQAGLYSYWSMISEIDYNVFNKMIFNNEEDDDPFRFLILTMTHLEVVFFIWIIGVCISFFVFVLEKIGI